jgi:hypothetical protein
MRKAQEVERLRFTQTPLGPLPASVPAELDQPGLVRVQFQPELREPLAKLGQELPRILLLFEADDEIVRPPHDDHITVCVAVPPPVSPQVEDVMQVHVREQR